MPIPLNTVICGNNYEILKTFPDNSFDSIVTDPPYGLGDEPDVVKVLQAWLDTGHFDVSGKKGFMNKEWDGFVPQPALWKECFRVLKPGGHLLSFAGTRTYDWVVMGLRIAGFEIRDQLQWIYGTGFPKSRDISKEIDRTLGAEREVLGISPNSRNSERLTEGGFTMAELKITKAATMEAKAWDGWGTGLKPANEPICMARKPFKATIANNVLQYGTGGINIDQSRIATEEKWVGRTGINNPDGPGIYEASKQVMGAMHDNGRWPTNVILGCACESDTQHDEGCAVAIMDAQTGTLKSGAPGGIKNSSGKNGYNDFGTGIPVTGYGDQGGGSRFFYVAKASREERNRGLEAFEPTAFGRGNQALAEIERGITDKQHQSGMNFVKMVQNAHPTVKPVTLMRYLVRMVTPVGGVCLDLFGGSGTTGVACKVERINYVLIDREQEYVDYSESRIAAWEPEKEQPKQLALFI